MDESEPNWKRLIGPACILLAAAFLVISDVRGWFRPSTAFQDGEAAMQSGNYAKAIHNLSRAQRECERDIAARYALGAAYHNYGWHDEALEEYDATWDLAAHNATRAMHSAGRIHAQRGEFDQAIACFQRALALTPASPDVWFELGQTHLQRGERELAAQALQQALTYDPENPVYHQAREQMP